MKREPIISKKADARERMSIAQKAELEEREFQLLQKSQASRGQTKSAASPTPVNVKEKRKVKRLTFDMPQHIYDAVSEIAEREGFTVTRVINDLLREGVKNHPY